jgi:hypothetical protein
LGYYTYIFTVRLLLARVGNCYNFVPNCSYIVLIVLPFSSSLNSLLFLCLRFVEFVLFQLSYIAFSYFDFTSVVHVHWHELSSSFYSNGRGDLCPREQQGGTMSNPPISVQVSYCEPLFQPSHPMFLYGVATARVSSMLPRTILKDVQKKLWKEKPQGKNL